MPLSGTTLKWIAVISMLIDHTAEVLINHNTALTDPIWAQICVLMRGIGRIAFPIYAFLLVEGFLHTRDVKKYLETGACFDSMHQRSPAHQLRLRRIWRIFHRFALYDSV